jgi:hypothetical protein
MADRWGSRFENEADPLSVMGNLVDVMLVFACGLIAALISSNPQLSEALTPSVEQIEQGRELPSMPDSLGEDGSGFESVGTVYRDPESGKLILVGP